MPVLLFCLIQTLIWGFVVIAIQEQVKKIPLTQGKFAIVDAKNFDWLNQWKWYAHFNGWNWYAMRGVWENGKRTAILMHRSILGLELGDGKQIDHINNNSLDNREDNLRLCTTQQNARNQKRHKKATSKYKGVYWYKNYKKWGANICINNKNINLGYFENEFDAAAAYDLAALKYFGEFAKTNFEISLAI
jgi:hypothetical protein